MTSTPTAIEVNCETGEVIQRPLTTEELAQREIDMAEFAAKEAEREAEATRITALKNSAKAKLVSGEPLTEEEAATIVL
jgi:hypothetical protein